MSKRDRDRTARARRIVEQQKAAERRRRVTIWTSVAVVAVLLIFIGGIASAWARGLQIDCGCFSSGGELAGGQNPQYAWEIARDVGFLILAAILLWKPWTRWSLDGLLMRERDE